MNRIFITLLLPFLLLLSAPVLSQAANPPPPPLNDSNRTELINDVSQGLTETYIFEDVANEMVELINGKLKRGEYDSFDTVAGLADQLTADLQSISHDLHLSVRAAEPPPASNGGADLTPEERARRHLAQAQARNFGFQKIEMLPGNIGYLKLNSFEDAGIGGDTAVAAMNFLANSSAIIFDLRQNGGGSPSMIQLISSYLFDERQHLNSFHIRRTESIDQFWTQARVDGPKIVDTPVYILTSGRTFSAAEEFTYNLKNMERATVVGETTGGGAHPVEMVRMDLGDGHWARMSLPFGRAVNPITGTNWEGTGVTPNIETPAGQALEIAQIEILRDLSEAAGNDNDRFRYDWALQELEFQLNPPGVLPESVSELVGQYGPRKITLENDQLMYQRDNGSKLQLLPMNQADTFHVGDLSYFRLGFERDSNGAVTGVVGYYDNGNTDRNARQGK